jgi:hypothetical protein
MFNTRLIVRRRSHGIVSLSERRQRFSKRFLKLFMPRSIARTDMSIQSADLPEDRQGTNRTLPWPSFDRLCFVHGIEPRLTKPNHPPTDGQVHRMNRTIKDVREPLRRVLIF